jgi:putative ABC transport system substrate-binding protein
MRRIGLAVVLAVSLTLAPLEGEAQPTEQVRRIGFLSGTSPNEVRDAFRDGLKEQGYTEGQNLLIEWRFADGRADRLPGFATELVNLKVAALVTLGTDAGRAAKKATSAIPIVFTQVTDPIASGLVPNLARPGGNLTGFSTLALELTGKRLELLKEAVPSLKSVIILTDSPNAGNSAVALKEAQIAARKLGLETRPIEVRDADQLEPAFTTMAREGAGGIVLLPSYLFTTHRSQLAELAIKSRLPMLSWTDAISGALISYGPSTSDILRRAGVRVAKILKGAKPADFPVEQPTKFELIINLKTAKALGLTISQSLLLRADHIIE